MKTYSVRIEPRAWKKVDGTPRRLAGADWQEKILAAIESLENAPRPPGCKKLKDRGGLFRIRVGDFRVLYDIKDEILVILVVDVGDRKEIYD